MSALEIHQFPCLSDNYGYLVHDPVSGETAVIDTPDVETPREEAAQPERNFSSTSQQGRPDSANR